MQNCEGCKSTPIALNCIKSEEELSFEYKNFTEVIVNLDEGIQSLKKILSSKIDKKSWIKTDHENIVGYIQEIINQLDIILKETAPSDKFFITSDLVKGEKSAAEFINILFKEVSALKKQLNQESTSLYLR